MMKNVNYINAGAGSGKTYKLTEIMSDLLQAGQTRPSRVILTTFTELAAAEFKEKTIEKLVSKGLYEEAAQIDSAIIGTVHSLAFKYIRKYWYLLGMGSNLQPMPEEQEQQYVQESLSQIATDDDVSFFRDYADKLNIIIPQSSRKDYDMWLNDLKQLVENSETFGIWNLDDSKSYASDQLKEFLDAPHFFDTIKDNLENNHIKVLSDTEYKDLILKYQRRIYDLAGKWKKQFDEFKRQHNIVSFNDMERLFTELLDKPEVREDIHESIDYIFVDEFQDSNPTQIRIFDKLSELVGKGSYWVGDPKQAIYDFRGCDTELVSAITDIIKNKSDKEDPGFSYTPLRRSWRSAAILVELANKTFVPVFDKLDEDKIKLTPTRAADTPSQVPNIHHWMMNVYNPDTNRRITNTNDLASYVATGVFEILNGQNEIRQVLDKNTKKLRPVRPSDIAILCTRNSDCDTLARELRALNIPVSRDTSVDTNNLQTMLVITILSYIAEYKAPDILKAELTSLLKDKTFEDIVNNKDTLFNDDIFATLDSLKETLKDQPVSVIVESVINVLDLYREAGKWGDGHYRKLCLSALVSAAANYEQQSLLTGRISTLSGFINYISTTSFAISKEVQNDGVNVLTYHSSKGLEWNIVIMCSLNNAHVVKDNDFKKKSYIGVNVIRKLKTSSDDIYYDFLVRYIPRFLSSDKSNLPQSMLDQISELKEYGIQRELTEYQDARLLYVGMTRARDYLISVSADEKKMDWFKELGIQFNIPKDAPDGTMVQIWGPDSPKACLKNLENLEDKGFTDKDKTFDVLKLSKTHTDYDPLYLVPSKAQIEIPGLKVRTPLNITDGAVINCQNVSGRASDMGTCIHNIFELYNPVDRDYNLRMATRLISQFEFSGDLTPAEVVASIDSLYKYLNKTYGLAEKGIKRELPFISKIGSQISKGEIDMVWETANGCVIIDYKNYKKVADPANPDSADYAGNLAPQLSIYKTALKEACKNVIDTLIYYPIEGCLVGVEIPD